MTAEISLPTPGHDLAAESGPAPASRLTRLTLRGVALGGFAAYLITFPVRHNADIVAAVFAMTVLVILAALFGLTLISGRRLKRDLALTVSYPEGEELAAGRNVGCLLKTGATSMWPLYHLTARVRFAHGAVAAPAHRLTGTSRDSRLLPLPLVFPHRGRWQLHAIDVSFGDQLGLTEKRWSISADELRTTITIRPPRRHVGTLPVLTSSARSGDLVSDVRERLGDPLDLKPYHPADGMRRIAWKIFARRGELIARHPEASITPEGQVVVYVLARADEDEVAGAALAYIRQLDESGLEFFVGCEGMLDRPPARSIEAASDLLVDSVWHADRVEHTGPEMGIAGFIERVRAALGPVGSVERVVVFCSARRLGRAADAHNCELLARHLESAGIRPLFFIDTTRPPAAEVAPRTWVDRLADIVVTRPESVVETATIETYEGFVGRAVQSGWECVRIREGER